MQEFVYTIPGAEYEKLKKVLEADPYANDSFAKNGYTLRESDSLGLEPGNYVLHFKAEEPVAAALVKRLTESVEEKFAKTTEGKQLSEEQKQAILKGLKEKELVGLKQLHGSDKETVCKKIAEQEASAAEGFGSIFG